MLFGYLMSRAANCMLKLFRLCGSLMSCVSSMLVDRMPPSSGVTVCSACWKLVKMMGGTYLLVLMESGAK